MRLNKLFILYSLFGILMASCIKDEAPNAEADITGISFEEDVLANSYIDLNPSYDESQNAYPIRISVKEGTDMTSPVSYTHLDVYKRQTSYRALQP